VHVSLALSQIARIAQLCDFLAHPEIMEAIHRGAPVTVPHDIGALGFDAPLWIGLGTVGLWSALDAYTNRSSSPKTKCPTCHRGGCLWGRLSPTGKLDASQTLALAELEDMRHLFAHNYAGQADAMYFGRARHILSSGVPMKLSSGAIFDGTSLSLNAMHLRYYAERSQSTVQALS
jgi:hypothetical protein